MKKPKGKKKPEDNLDLSLALFQVVSWGMPGNFLEECLEWEGPCQEWQECLDSTKSQ